MSDAPFLKQTLQNFDGLLLPMEFFTIEKFREAREFRPTAEDIVVSTYPKCGTTWTQYIVWEILNDGATPPYVNEIMWTLCPQLEFRGTKNLDQLTKRPRCLKTHFPFDYVPYTSEGRFIYISRNPWDALMSNFNFHRQAPGFGFEGGTLNDYFENFMTGHMGWGDYFHHIRSWYEVKDRDNVLFLTYEEMKVDLRASVLSIANFMDPKYGRKLMRDNDMLQRILKHTDFEYMKNIKFIVPKSGDVVERTGQLDVGQNDSVTETGEYGYMDFFPVGRSNYGKSMFSDDQKKRLSDRIAEQLEPYCPDLIQTWKNCGIDL